MPTDNVDIPNCFIKAFVMHPMGLCYVSFCKNYNEVLKFEVVYMTWEFKAEHYHITEEVRKMLTNKKLL